MYITQIPFLNAYAGVQVVSAIPNHLDGRSAPGQVPTGSVCYERNGVWWTFFFFLSLAYCKNNQS